MCWWGGWEVPRWDLDWLWSGCEICFAWLCCCCCFVVDYTADSISCPSWRLTCFVSLRSIEGSTILLGLTPADTDLVIFRNCHTGGNSNKSDQRFDLLIIQSNVQDSMLIKEVQEEKWAYGNSVWYWFIYSQKMHLIRFTTLHTNVKWHTNK